MNYSDMSNSNIGRYDVVKAAFSEYILNGLDCLLPVTPAIDSYNARERAAKMAICPDRMVDKAEELLAQYEKSSTGGASLNAPLPIVLCAFAKDTMPIAPDRGMSIPNAFIGRLSDNIESPAVDMYFDHVESRVQLAFIAHEGETVRSILSQMRLYINAFENHRWAINWVHNGECFTTTCSMDSYEPMSEMVEIEGRTNITIMVWSLTLNFQIPYIGKRHSYVTEVSFGINSETRPISEGIVNKATMDIGRWVPK